MAKSKGAPKTGGRQKGVPNKVTQDVRKAIIEAFEKAGGADYLLTLATSDPRTFCTLLGKTVPTQISGDEDGSPVKHILEVKWVTPSKDSA
jgi:hypothetical protein